MNLAIFGELTGLIIENPTEMDDWEGSPILGNLHWGNLGNLFSEGSPRPINRQMITNGPNHIQVYSISNRPPLFIPTSTILICGSLLENHRYADDNWKKFRLLVDGIIVPKFVTELIINRSFKNCPTRFIQFVFWVGWIWPTKVQYPIKSGFGFVVRPKT